MKLFRARVILLMIISILFFSTCSFEKNYCSDYVYLNNTEYDLLIIRFGDSNITFKGQDTIPIPLGSRYLYSTNSEVSFHDELPLANADSIIFIAEGYSSVTYTNAKSGKSPFNESSYLKIDNDIFWNEKQLEFKYLINIEDF